MNGNQLKRFLVRWSIEHPQADLDRVARGVVGLDSDAYLNGAGRLFDVERQLESLRAVGRELANDGLT